jgi:glycerol uptake facilitator-like aquaporin
MEKSKIMKKYIAEFIGTFALVFCGTGAIIINQETNGVITHSGIAITFGLIVMCMIYTFGEISGAQFNPARTIAFAFAGRFDKKEVLPACSPTSQTQTNVLVRFLKLLPTKLLVSEEVLP